MMTCILLIGNHLSHPTSSQRPFVSNRFPFLAGKHSALKIAPLYGSASLFPPRRRHGTETFYGQLMTLASV